MKKLLLFAFLLLPCLAHAQGVSIRGEVTVNTPVGNVPGFTSALQAVSNATVTACSSSGGGIPCSPTATIYKNSALTIVASNPLAACVGAATQGCIDANGNYQFWVPPNNNGYLVSQSGPSIVGSLNAVSAPVTESATETLTNKTLVSPPISNPTSTGTDAGVETLSNKTCTSCTLPSPIITGTPSGVGIPTYTLKQGSGAGSYTTTGTSLADVDATNLSYTVLIPVGWKLAVICSLDVFSSTASANILLSIFDTQSASNIAFRLTNPAFPNSGGGSLGALIVGDGNSHTLKLRFATGTGADAANIRNTTGSDIPTMLFILSPSN